MCFDRRRKSRLNLRVHVVLVRTGWPSPLRIHSETENVSVDGFFCHSCESFGLGDCLDFVMDLQSATGRQRDGETFCIEGVGQVARITATSMEAGFGIGVRIKSYRVLYLPNALRQTVFGRPPTEPTEDTHRVSISRGVLKLQ